MKKILKGNFLSIIFSVFFFLLSTVTYAQYDSTRALTPVNADGFSWKTGKFRGPLILCRDTFKLKCADSGALAYKSGTLYIYTCPYWQKIAVDSGSGPVDTVKLTGSNGIAVSGSYPNKNIRLQNSIVAGAGIDFTTLDDTTYKISSTASPGSYLYYAPTPELVDSTVTVVPNIIFYLNGVRDTITSSFDVIIPAVAPGYYRTDLIYIDNTGTIDTLRGKVDSSRIIPPIPDGGIAITYVDVFGSVITPPTIASTYQRTAIVTVGTDGKLKSDSTDLNYLQGFINIGANSAITRNGISINGSRSLIIGDFNGMINNVGSWGGVRGSGNLTQWDLSKYHSWTNRGNEYMRLSSSSTTTHTLRLLNKTKLQTDSIEIWDEAAGDFNKLFSGDETLLYTNANGTNQLFSIGIGGFVVKSGNGKLIKVNTDGAQVTYTHDNGFELPDSTGIGVLRVRINGTTYSASQKGTVDVGTISPSSTDVFNEQYSGSTSSTITIANSAVAGTVRLTKNGVRLPASEYSVSGTTVTLSSSRLTTDVFIIDYKY